jgi:non-homologous end joining protein Ku
VVAPESETAGQVTDIMEALRASLEQARKRKSGGDGEEPKQAAAKPRKTSRTRKKAA